MRKTLARRIEPVDFFPPLQTSHVLDFHHRLLADPDESRPNLDTPFVAPRTSVEDAIAKIWADILCVDRVGVHDNFFDLGGHSLAAARVVSRVMKTFQLEFPIKALFDSPTVAELAAVITQHQAKRASQKDLERLLSELEAMSQEEAERTLALTRAKRENADAKG